MRRFLAGLPGGSGTLWAVVLCVVLVAAGVYIQQGRNAERAAALVNASLVKPTPAAAPAALAEQTDDVQAEDTVSAQAPDVMTSAPEFDEVRRELDGMTVIAGQGTPGAVVSVLQNGVEIATSTVDRSGKFATLALIPQESEALSLTLSQMSSGVKQVSEGEILLAPLSASVGVAKDVADAVKVGETVEPDAVVETADAGATSEAADADPVIETADADAVIETPEPADPVETIDIKDTPEPAEKPEENTQSTVIAQTQAPAQSVTAAEVETLDVSPVQGASETAITPEALTQDVTPETQILAALDPSPPAPTAVLRSTAEGVELLNAPVPEVMDNVMLDIISYSDAGEVQLAGRAQSPSNSIRIYLNNRAVVVLPVDAEGRWRGDVPDVDEGIYTLRVDEIAADGSIASRVETPFKREATEALAAASAGLDGPINAITVQKGATLWAIARDRYGAGELYVRVFEANKQAIRDPDLIYPGQIFELPE